MNKGAQFVMDKSVQPVIDYYEKIIKPQKGVISDEKFKDIQKMYKTSIGAKSVLSSLIEIGDVYKYIKYIVKNNNKESRDRFINYNLTPFEKIINEFENKFRRDLDKVLYRMTSLKVMPIIH